MTYEESIEILKGEITDDGGLYSLGHYMAYMKGSSEIVLDDTFDLVELEAIVTYMKGNTKL